MSIREEIVEGCKTTAAMRVKKINKKVMGMSENGFQKY